MVTWPEAVVLVAFLFLVGGMLAAVFYYARKP